MVEAQCLVEVVHYVEVVHFKKSTAISKGYNVGLRYIKNVVGYVGYFLLA